MLVTANDDVDVVQRRHPTYVVRVADMCKQNDLIDVSSNERINLSLCRRLLILDGRIGEGRFHRFSLDGHANDADALSPRVKTCDLAYLVCRGEEEASDSFALSTLVQSRTQPHRSNYR